MFLEFHNMFTKHTHTLTNKKNSGIRIQNILIAKRQNPYTPDKLVLDMFCKLKIKILLNDFDHGIVHHQMLPVSTQNVDIH